MDIYLLRDGKEFGPFSEETTQSFLKQGTLVMDDLAWTPGLPAWSPLVQVLYPGRSPVEQKYEIHSEPPVVFQREQPVEAEAVREEILAGEPPTAKQKAFLNYMGIPFPTGTTKEAAAILVNEAMEDPKLNARVLHWNDDRLRLHPDLFAAEAQAKKEDRANRYFDICRHEGADILVDVTKAHCQVLVGYLDVNFPNWDAHESDAPRAYFFPAVAEKFPQCVRKEWRDKLKYSSGPRIAADFGKRTPSTRLHTGPSPLGALIRGAVFGLALLLLLYVGVQMLTGDPVVEAPDFTSADPVQSPNMARPPEPVNPAATTETDLVKTDTAPSSTPAEPPAMDAEPATPAAPKTHVIIAKPVDVKLRFGTAKITAGTQFKIIAQDATSVTVIYGAETVTIPIENTDLAAPSSEQ
ncbi:MAG: GYF domain-containing protein [Chthoniobacteraceae bacterium]